MININNNRVYTKIDDAENGEIVLLGNIPFMKVNVDGEIFALNLANYTLYKKHKAGFEFCEATFNILESTKTDNGLGMIIVDGDTTYMVSKFQDERIVYVNIEEGIGKVVEKIDDIESNFIFEINIY